MANFLPRIPKGKIPYQAKKPSVASKDKGKGITSLITVTRKKAREDIAEPKILLSEREEKQFAGYDKYTFTVEREIITTDFLATIIANIIAANGWGPLCVQPPLASIPSIKEFYANFNPDIIN
ncbi:Uncharacterized protein Fot_42807 [Forsythia ovata]|uniref:Uncharacterized protein n=1 Tax=Forsythia ovata TaxID=205694 RepID=A0ABD1RM87_9LAMI